MSTLVKYKDENAVSVRTLRASQVLKDYEYWLMHRYGKAGTYLVNAKTFLKTYRAGGTIISQLESYATQKGQTIQSFLRRFRGFLEEKQIDFVINDLNEEKIPKGNIYVRLFLYHRQDRLRGELSSSTYATILNQYFNRVGNNLEQFNKRTAEKFILSPALSDYTRRLYKSVLRAFCEWALLYRDIPGRDLNKDQRMVQKGLRLISGQSLKEISAIRVKSSRSQLKSYHKGSLSHAQRARLLKQCRSQRDRTIIALMAWNGLRTIEVMRLNFSDCQLKRGRIAVWSKGKSARAKDVIKLFDIPMHELSKHFKKSNIKKGKAFPGLVKSDIEAMIAKGFRKLRVKKSEKFSPHSLRHTAGQLMYDKGVKLEFIQKTLRHSIMETTLVYAQKAIDRNYFRSMPSRI